MGPRVREDEVTLVAQGPSTTPSCAEDEVTLVRRALLYTLARGDL